MSSVSRSPDALLTALVAPPSAIFFFDFRQQYDDLRHPFEEENGVGFINLIAGNEYWVLIEENKEVKAITTKAAEVAAVRITKEKEEDCSCIQGVACLSAYNCKDWANRFVRAVFCGAFTRVSLRRLR